MNLQYYRWIKGNLGRMARSVVRTKTAGFTLLELMVVLVIIAIGAVMAIPMMSSAGSVQIRAAANMIAADLEYAKGQAIGKQKMFKVVFDSSSESYSIKDNTNTVIDHPVKKGFSYNVDLQSDSRLSRVDIYSADFNSDSTIQFDYLGSPLDAGGGPVNNAVITLKADGMTVTITVEAVTGYITISE